MRFQYGIRDLLTVVLQIALVLSLIASVLRIGVIRYNSGAFGLGPPEGWLLYGLPLSYYLIHAILVAAGFVIAVFCLARSPRRTKLPRPWVGWLPPAFLLIFFVCAFVLRPDIKY
jgi:hypothetical protein